MQQNKSLAFGGMSLMQPSQSGASRAKSLFPSLDVANSIPYGDLMKNGLAAFMGNQVLGQGLGQIGNMSNMGQAAWNAALAGGSNLGGNNSEGLMNMLGNTFSKGGNMSNILGGVGQAAGLVGGLMDMYNSRKLMKSNLQSMALAREMARENLDMQRAEYARLKNNRAAITAAYASKRG